MSATHKAFADAGLIGCIAGVGGAGGADKAAVRARVADFSIYRIHGRKRFALELLR